MLRSGLTWAVVRKEKTWSRTSGGRIERRSLPVAVGTATSFRVVGAKDGFWHVEDRASAFSVSGFVAFSPVVLKRIKELDSRLMCMIETPEDYFAGGYS